MGCEVSTPKDNHEEEQVFDGARRNTIIVKPNVKLSGGGGISVSNDGPRIVFIFGGPGSGKGTVVNNLVDMFGFHFICGEDLILENLARKLLPEDDIENHINTKKLASLVAENPSELTLEWVLDMIIEEVSKCGNRPVLIDIMPNLKFLLRVETFVKKCNKEMTWFEKKFPIALAINLTLDQDHLISNINQTHACVKAPAATTESTGGKSDELDTSRTTRRFKLYENSVKEFIDYFKESDRLLSVDTSVGKGDMVWEAVRDYVSEIEFAEPKKVVDMVIVFCFDPKEALNVDLNRYPMKEITLKDLGDGSDKSAKSLLKNLATYLDKCASQTKAFLVNLQGVEVKDMSLEKLHRSSLIFIDVDVGQLDYFIHGLKRRTERRKSIVRKQAQTYKAVGCVHNQTMLFPQDTDTELCRKIAVYVDENRQF